MFVVKFHICDKNLCLQESFIYLQNNYCILLLLYKIVLYLGIIRKFDVS